MTTLTTELNWDALTNEAVKHLQALIRCNTANPPGNEAPAIAYIREWLAEGVVAYGFDPMKPEPGWPGPLEMAHGHDEHISIANIAFGLRVLYDAIIHIAR